MAVISEAECDEWDLLQALGLHSGDRPVVRGVRCYDGCRYRARLDTLCTYEELREHFGGVSDDRLGRLIGSQVETYWVEHAPGCLNAY